MVASPDTGDYGRLTVMLAPWVIADSLFDVGPGAFQPPPRVWSAVVRLTVRREPAFEVSPHFAEVVAEAFSHRRKTIRNALRGKLTVEQITACDVDPGARPETLAPERFNRLARTARLTALVPDTRLERRHADLPSNLLVLDLHEDSAFVGRKACALASTLGAEVELLHVVEFVPVEPTGETICPRCRSRTNCW